MKLIVLCVHQDARSQISTTLLAAREKGRFAQSRFPDPLNGLGAGVVERDVQSAVGADGLFDERDDVILPADIGLHEHGASTGRSDLPGDPPLPRQRAGRRRPHSRHLWQTPVALPMPEVPPVMRTVLFSKVFIVGLNVAKKSRCS